MTLRKLCPSLKVATVFIRNIRSIKAIRINIVISFVIAISFALIGSVYSVNADEGYIGNNKIVIDGVTYEDRESSFSTTQTYPTYSSNSSHSNLTITPTVICDSPSQFSCTDIGNSEVITIGEPVLGTFNKYSSLWQEVIYNGETKYIPFDFLTATSDERVEITDKLISESVNNVSYSNNNKSYNENEVQKSLKDNHYDIYNSFTEKGYPKSIICKSALQLAGNDLEKISIAQSWCRENIADYDDIKWRIFENMYMYYSGGDHSALSTCTWAYLDDNKEVKKEPKLSHVLSWCSDNGISEENIKNELGISDDKTKGKNSIYSLLDAMLKRDGMSIERICSGEVTSGSGVNRQSFSSWCKERWDKREQAMIKWMDNHIKGGNTAWDACRLAVGGKENKPDEYEVVIKWCKKHGVTEEDIKNEFSINDTYYAWGNIGNEVTVDPNMDNGPSPYRIVWEMGEKTFNIRKEEGTPSNRADPTKNTYIIIHGWNEPYLNKCKDAVWPEKMATSILRTDPNAQVLRVDWGNIACTKSPTQASKWISSITDLTSEVLKKWGVNGNKTTIIGFSLGTLLGEEISKEISGSKTIMLDPAEEGLFGYNIDYNNTSFSGFSGDERCIVGASSIFGDESATEYCKENYLVDYYDRYNHSKINELFKEFSINLGKGIVTDKFKNLSRDDIAWSYTVDGTKAIIEASAKYDNKYVALGTVTGFLLDKTIEKGCTVAAAGTGPFAPATKLLCDAAISTAIDELQNAIMQTKTEHSWVHETYDTIIEYPFHKNILSLHDQQNFSLMSGGVFNVDHRGMIYTERKKSRSIKYLKTLSGDRYILYGNTQSNKMECIGDIKCEMYGDKGNDKFYQQYRDSIFTINDFKGNNGDGDKLFLRSDISGLEAKQSENGKVDVVIMGGGDKNPTPYGKITLVGPSYREVEGWVEILTGTGKYADYDKNALKEKRKNNPIQIKSK